MTANLTNHFLIAMPNLTDPNFYRTVTYICEHNEQRAMGLVLTRTTDFCFSELMQQMQIHSIQPELRNKMILAGGPVATDSGFILHRPIGNWDSTISVTDNVGLTTSADILNAIANEQAPQDAIITLGYAGWDGGQLENEIADNIWLTHPADEDILFNTAAEQLWHAVANAMGIDLCLISGEAGHA